MEKIIPGEKIPDFFGESSLLFLERPVFHHRVRPGNPFDTEYYRCNRVEFDELIGTYGELNREGQEIYLARLNDSLGWGLFTAQNIKSGALIGEYTGIVRPVRTTFQFFRKKKYKTDYNWDYPSLTDCGQLLELDASSSGNEIRYINHSVQPNCAVDHFPRTDRWVVFYRAVKDIPAGTQLTVDYGWNYWEGGFRTLDLSS